MGRNRDKMRATMRKNLRKETRMNNAKILEIKEEKLRLEKEIDKLIEKYGYGNVYANEEYAKLIDQYEKLEEDEKRLQGKFEPIVQVSENARTSIEIKEEKLRLEKEIDKLIEKYGYGNVYANEEYAELIDQYEKLGKDEKELQGKSKPTKQVYNEKQTQTGAKENMQKNETILEPFDKYIEDLENMNKQNIISDETRSAIEELENSSVEVENDEITEQDKQNYANWKETKLELYRAYKDAMEMAMKREDSEKIETYFEKLGKMRDEIKQNNLLPLPYVKYNAKTNTYTLLDGINIEKEYNPLDLKSDQQVKDNLKEKYKDGSNNLQYIDSTIYHKILKDYDEEWKLNTQEQYANDFSRDEEELPLDIDYNLKDSKNLPKEQYKLMKKIAKRHKDFYGVEVEEDKKEIRGFLGNIKDKLVEAKDKVKDFVKRRWKRVAIGIGAGTLALGAGIHATKNSEKREIVPNSNEITSEMDRNKLTEKYKVSQEIMNAVNSVVAGLQQENQISLGTEIELTDEIMERLSPEEKTIYYDSEYSTPIGSLENLEKSERKLRISSVKEIQDGKYKDIKDNDIQALLKENPDAEISVHYQHYTQDGKIENAGWTPYSNVQKVIKVQQQIKQEKQAQMPEMEK